MDPDVEESENFNSDSLQAKSDYHNIIKYYFEENFMLCSQYEQGLLIDIQGHENDDNKFEIGYLLEPQQTNYNYYNSSIRQMASVSNFVFDDLIHGFYSLGKRLVFAKLFFLYFTSVLIIFKVESWNISTILTQYPRLSIRAQLVLDIVLGVISYDLMVQ